MFAPFRIAGVSAIAWGCCAAAGARGVDLAFSPPSQTVQIGSTVNIKIVVSSPGPGGQAWDAMDAVISYDPTFLKLTGASQAGAGAAFFLAGFLPDPDGVNVNIMDGTAIFTALAPPGTAVIAPPAPAELVVTTLQFQALVRTPMTVVDYLRSIGIFGHTVVYLGGGLVTGDIDATAEVEIVTPTCPGDGNCFTIHPTPGCLDESCCDLICSFDPACCFAAWDADCVAEAVLFCDGCGHPDSGACCAAHGAPFCDDRTCCELVCGVDPFCCNDTWDATCAAEAADFPQCGCDPCLVSEESCFDAHATPGCEDTACCNAVCAVDPTCCADQWDIDCKNQANVLCGNCGSPGAGSCFCPHANKGCQNAVCCRAVCEVDPFCCEVQWDGACASEANMLCACKADFNNDGVVDGGDLGLMLAAWNTNQCPFDLDGSGNVDGGDLGILLAAWGPCP